MEEDLGEILEKIDVETYLDREGITYRESHGSSGPQFNIKTCPKCGGDKWKVFLNRETGLGNCFSGSCEAKFNKWSFIQAHTGLSGRNMIEHVKSVSAEMGWRPKRKTVVAVTESVTELKMPHSLELPIKGQNLAYLENRGITLDVAKYFHLRYCHKGLFPYLYNDKKCFMNFSRRILIPIYDLDGALVSFQGRDITGEAEKKYLFPPGFASTGEYLYNGHNAQKTERVVVGEGVFDVAAQKIAFDADPDLRDIVPIGSFGKSIAEGQLAQFLILKERGVKEVTIMWDGELVATEDAVAAAKVIKGLGFKSRIAYLPKGKDPNEVAPSVVRQSYWSAVEYSDMNAAKLILRRRAE